MDKFLTSLRDDGSLADILVPSAPPKTPEISPEKPKNVKPPVKRKVYEDDKDKDPEPVAKSKPCGFNPTVRTLLQPMLATTLYLCTPCSNETRTGKLTELTNGKTSTPVVMCAHCTDFNGRLRVAHIEEIIRHFRGSSPVCY